MKRLIAVSLAAAGTILPAARGAVAGFTPETSPLFEKVVEPESGVVSYSLKYGKPGDNRQSLYFTTKSMTEDGRFLLFYHTDAEGNDEARKKPKTLMVADLQKGTVRPVARTADGT